MDYSNFKFPKPIKKEKVKKPIKKKSNKLARLEKNRKSIIQKEKKCFICDNDKNLDIHEAFGGRNRQISMRFGLVYYLCRKCHSKTEINTNIKRRLQNNAKEIFINKYSEEEFIKNFK